MASASTIPSHKVDIPLANPWPWLVAGLALCIWSWLWTLSIGEGSSENRIIVLAVGVLVMGAGVCLRYRNRDRAYLAEWLPPLAVVMGLALGLAFACIVLGVTVLLVAAFFVGGEIGWRPVPTFLVWLSAGPLAFFAARRCLVRSGKQGPLDVEEEISLAFVVAAGGAFAGSLALYLGPKYANDWDTIRLFLRVLTAAALYAAAFVLVSTRVRRIVFSFLIVLHFAGISTAALSAPPAPWLVQQIWVRVFRPYLEFMYLNNAYHFYAPEPGPAGYLWFRVIYADENGHEHGLWYKVPEIDDDGKIRHPVALEYQRFLAMTESTAPFDPQPPWVDVYNNYTLPYKERMWLQPHMVQQRAIAHMPQVQHVAVPLHPLIGLQQQIFFPNESSRKMVSSYAEFVARKFEKHPEKGHEGWTFKWVKVYRVVHYIPPVEWYSDDRASPTDPALYRPYYMGRYDAKGTLLDGEGGQRDPYLYWLLPILRKRMEDRNSEVLDYCRKHAGDPDWTYFPNRKAMLAPGQN